jgi:opacity protein-like surface antigen
MLNAYYDFNLTWGRPYVGAGIGFASNKIDSIVNSGGALGAFSATAPGGTSTGLAWAVMGGISFPINPTLTLDVGYRYIDLGDIESDSGSLSCAPAACPGATYSGLSGKLRAHELMIGLRF